MPKESKSHNPKDIVGYTLGILSIVFGFISPFAGLILGIIGHSQVKKPGSDLAKGAKKINLIGIVISIIVLIVSAIAFYQINRLGIGSFPSLP